VLKTREKFRKVSEGLGNVFREGSTRVDVPTAEEERESFRDMLREVRRKDLLADQSLETVISFLSLSHRLEVIADNLESCRNQALALTIERYWGDYVLWLKRQDNFARALARLKVTGCLGDFCGRERLVYERSIFLRGSQRDETPAHPSSLCPIVFWLWRGKGMMLLVPEVTSSWSLPERSGVCRKMLKPRIVDAFLTKSSEIGSAIGAAKRGGG
jgi:hypothetical protein